MSERQLSALAGSQLALPSGAEPAGPVDDDERVELTLVLRPPDSRPAAGSPEARHGPRLEDVNAVLGWAAECALALEALSPVARTIRLSAPLGRWRELLDLELSLYAQAVSTYPPAWSAR